MKSSLKTQAIALRKQGLSYSEILEQIPVAKSTLSLWLRDVGLAKQQAQRLTERKRVAGLRGGQARKDARIKITEEIISAAVKDIGSISQRELFLIGVALYWAEGSKEKEHRVGSGVKFSNSDPNMIRLFLRWLTDICEVNKADIYFDLTIHENHTHRVSDVIKIWARHTGYPPEDFTHVYFKKNNVMTKRTNTRDAYIGQLQIRVRKSSPLLRKVAGWTEGMIEWAGK